MREDEKLTKEYLIDEIKEELIIYFRRGIINPKSFFEINDVRFTDIYDILKIHFILSNEVKNYIIDLEKNIRNIKNSTQLEKEIFYGGIRGNIDWNKTIEYRANAFYRDNTKFIGDSVNKLYDTKGNLILKGTIQLLYDIIHDDIGMNRFTNLQWFSEGENLINIISRIYKNNVYLKRIDMRRLNVTDKMIEDTVKSRNKIYRDSAILLKLYKKIMKLDKFEVGKLFSNTFIDIEDEDRVFELYSIFKYLRENYPLDKVKYNTLDGREEYLAVIEDETYRYEVYHDSTGRPDIRFNIYSSEIEKSSNEVLKRKFKILEDKSKIYSELEKKNKSFSIWRGRPDLLIFKLYKETIIEITIGEVKYTNNRSYMYRGLEELLEYMHYIKSNNGEYLENIELKGLLFVDNIELEKREFGNITIINRDEQ